MKKIIGLSTLCATVIVASGCSGDKKTEAAASALTPDPTAWTDTINIADGSGIISAYIVKSYNANGQVAQTEEYAISKEGKTSRTENAIYQNGVIALVKSFDEDGVNDGLQTYTYNEAGKIVEELTQALDKEKGSFVGVTDIKYTYNEAGDVTEVKELTNVDLRWVESYDWTWAYDAQGRVSERKDYTIENKERKQSVWFTYEYDDQNRCVKRDFYKYDIKGGKLKHDAKSIFTYDAAGRILTETVIRHKNNQKRDDVNSRQFAYTYNDDGQLAYSSNSKWASATKSWGEVGNSRLEYDATKRVVTSTSNRMLTRGVKTVTETTTYGTPADKVQPTPATAAATAKADLDFVKYQTSDSVEE